MDEQLRREVRFLTTRLGAIVREQCGPKTFDAIETLRQLSKQIRQRPEAKLIAAEERAASQLTLARAEEVAHAFSLFFHLVNLCEERQRVRRLEAYEKHEAGASMSLRNTFNQLARQRVPSARVARLLASMRVEPVLTAHPTEAKRRSVLNHILRIGRTMDALAGELGESSAPAARTMDPWIEALWLTDEMRERAVTPQVEIESTLIFLERTIYDLAAKFWEKFTEEWTRFAPTRKPPAPFIGFGSWVGADRDGNPHVTPKTSLDAAEGQRQSILAYYRGACEQMLALLPFPCRNAARAREIHRGIERDMRRFPATRAFQDLDQPHELYRRKLRVMIWRLEQTGTRAWGAYPAPEEFVRDLQTLERILAKHPSPRVARVGPGRLGVAARVFGFHAARLDFRQHASVTRAAAGELLLAGGLPDSPGDVRIQSVHRLLEGPPQDLNLARLSTATQRTLAEFRVLKEIQNRTSAAASPYILSMTTSGADVWDVLLLARHAGLLARTPSAGWRSAIDIVPLFETVNDLEACPDILDQLLSDQLYRRILRSRGNFQEIMLGYSDSVKDSGYLSANLALFRAQKRLGRTAERHRIRLGLFHGKGGTIDRGGGQSYRSIQAQPYAAPGGRIRITEQGEVISLKYSHLAIAERNLEQLVTSVLDAHLLGHKHLPGSQLVQWEGFALELAASGREFYRQLVYETPEFPDYFRQATPIDLIEQLTLGSRPSRRTAKNGARHLHDLRAIPWVFAWTQSRQFLPSWYGLGFALEKFAAEDRGTPLSAPHRTSGFDVLRQMYRGWPFFALLIDNAEVSLAKTDLYIAGRYAALVRPKRLGEEIFRRIEQEYHRSVRSVLDISGARHLLERQPVLAESIRLRNPYVDPLNFLQLRFLKEWRRARRPQREILRLLQITVGGIAFGMKSTG
ncbi:MAG TPA: phosphoenolpyruvate carboxylase [Terriglobia bacterium]|nr:phosphoenolpyruvate carboxylase [Terriglobia bacterium]